MKIVTFLDGRAARLGVVRGDGLVEPVAPGPDRPADMLDLIRHADRWRPLLEDLSENPSPAARPLAEVRLAPPIANPGKVVAIGLNYVAHADESQTALPADPLIFAKFPSSIIGPGEPITWDRSLTADVDYEAELGVIIGTRARAVDRDDALAHVFGYTCLNDVSARDLQFADGQWVRSKSLDTFCPLGPWIVTADEIPDPHGLRIQCVVSGEVLQDASTADMHFDVAELIARLSRSFTLEPGDVIATGTPPGVGYFRPERRMLRDGDVVSVVIERIGELKNPVRLSTTGSTR